MVIVALAVVTPRLFLATHSYNPASLHITESTIILLPMTNEPANCANTEMF